MKFEKLNPIPAALRNTPWGIAQGAQKITEGLWFVDTASHGGVKVDSERWQQIEAAFPGFKGYAPAGWLEEDCDWALAVLLWPEAFNPVQVFAAVRLVQNYVAGYMDIPKRWLASPAGERVRQIAAEFDNPTKPAAAAVSTH